MVHVQWELQSKNRLGRPEQGERLLRAGIQIVCADYCFQAQHFHMACLYLCPDIGKWH